MLNSLSFDAYYMYLLSATEKENNWPQIIDAVVVKFQNLANFFVPKVLKFTPPTFIFTQF